MSEPKKSNGITEAALYLAESIKHLLIEREYLSEKCADLTKERDNLLTKAKDHCSLELELKRQDEKNEERVDRLNDLQRTIMFPARGLDWWKATRREIIDEIRLLQSCEAYAKKADAEKVELQATILDREAEADSYRESYDETVNIKALKDSYNEMEAELESHKKETEELKAKASKVNAEKRELLRLINKYAYRGIGAINNIKARYKSWLKKRGKK